jgi:hypothetical protein
VALAELRKQPEEFGPLLNDLLERLSDPAKDIGRLLVGQPTSGPVSEEVQAAAAALRKGVETSRRHAPRRKS